MDPGPWNDGNLAEEVAPHGRNWAIPLLAVMLTHTTTKDFGSGQQLSPADFALNHFQVLTGQNFGYDFRGPLAERSAAIAKARTWWEAEGKTALAAKINLPHEDPATDAFATDQQIAARVAAIESDRDATARAAIAELPVSYAVRVQRALLTRLAREKEAQYRVAIVQKLGPGVMWLAPAIARTFELDPDAAVRAAAGNLLLALEARPALETYEKTLQSVRRAADDAATPQPLRLIAAQILLKADSSLDDARLHRLRAQFPSDASLDRYFTTLQERRSYALLRDFR